MLVPRGGIPERKLFARHPEWLGAGEGRCWEWCSTGRGSQGFLGADRMRASQPQHCLLAIPAAEPLKLGALAAATGSQQPRMHGIEQVPARDVRDQDFLLF